MEKNWRAIGLTINQVIYHMAEAQRMQEHVAQKSIDLDDTVHFAITMVMDANSHLMERNIREAIVALDKATIELSKASNHAYALFMELCDSAPSHNRIYDDNDSSFAIMSNELKRAAIICRHIVTALS
jgi:hypothetical protein